MSASEVARAMGMAPRSYEHLEAGTGRITYERIVAFATATDSDPVAILTTVALGRHDFAVRCADNKLMTIMMIAMMELNEDLADDIGYLTAQILVGGFTKLARDLSQHVRKRETYAEEWLKQGSSKLGQADDAKHPGKLRPSRS